MSKPERIEHQKQIYQKLKNSSSKGVRAKRNNHTQQEGLVKVLYIGVVTFNRYFMNIKFRKTTSMGSTDGTSNVTETRFIEFSKSTQRLCSFKRVVQRY